MRGPLYRPELAMLRNICLYRLPAGSLPAIETVAAALREHPFTPCGATEPQRVGWVPALHDDTSAFVHGANGLYLLRLREQKRLLPAGVVNEQLQAEITKREQAEARKIGRKEQQRIKDDLFFSLLPKAFTKTDDVLAIVAPEAGLILVGTSSLKRAEMLLNALRLALGSLPVQRPAFSAPIESWMTNWLNGHSDMPTQFELGGECEIKDEEAVVRCKGLELASDEVRQHLMAGREITKLALTFRDSLSFMLNMDARLTRLQLSERLKGELSSQHAEDQLSERDAEFTLLGLTLLQLLPPLLVSLGETRNS